MRPRDVKRTFNPPNRSAGQVRTDISDEVTFHLDMRTDDLMRTGLSHDDARAQAMREFGTTGQAAATLARVGDRLEHRRRWTQVIAGLRQDARLGLRLLTRAPGFAAVAILTLALGIGANTAIYSVLDAAMLRPLPYPDADRVMMVSETRQDGEPNSTSGGAFLDWREHQTQFAALVLTGQVSYNLRGDGAPERLSGMEASHELLDVLGVAPLLGRGFLPEDDRPGGFNAVVMITEEWWRSRFAADPAIVGRMLVLDEVPRRVIGVLPRGAWLLKDQVFFVPAVLRPGTSRSARSGHWAGVFGRLAAGSTAEGASTDLNGIKTRLNAEYPAFKQRWGVQVRPVTDVIGGVARTPVLLLLAAVSLVLLIACANVANLLLARGWHREQELAVRASLGASGGRLVRQILTENFVLAAIGGLAGIAVAGAGVEMIKSLAAGSLPIALSPKLDWRVLMFSLLVTMATGPIVGLLPALRARRSNLAGAMNTGSKGTGGSGRQRTQSALVVVEVALTAVLLASAGLLLQSLVRTSAADPGFEPGRVLAFDLSMPAVSYASGDNRSAFIGEMLTRLRALPGVEAAGTGMAIPFSGGGFGEYFRRPGNGERDPVIGRIDFVSAGFLEALGTRLVAGRRIVETDNRANGPRVVVINDHTARLFFPAGQALDAPIVIASQTWRIVGIVADVVDRRLDVPRGAMAYAPRAFSAGQTSVAVRTSTEPLSMVPAVRAAMAALDPGVAVDRPRALDRAKVDSMAERRVILRLVLSFAVAALALAATGLYGVLAYGVAMRHREFGVRMAFGATRGDLIRQVLRGGLRVTLLGLVAGLLIAVGAAQLLSSQLFGVSGSDPLVLGGTALAILTVAVLASTVPAWRASRVELAEALRG